MRERLTEFLRDFRTLAAPYWSSEERWQARGLLAVVIALSLAQVGVLVAVNQWYQKFYDAIQNYDEAAFWRLIWVYIAIVVVFIVVAVYGLYLRQMLEIRWRRWLTDRWVGDWLAERAYYRLPLSEARADNPDQRIAEDLKLFVRSA